MAVEREQEAERIRREEAKAVYHTVVTGDMLLVLARKYGVSVDQICQLNNMTRNSILRLGRTLRIK